MISDAARNRRAAATDRLAALVPEGVKLPEAMSVEWLILNMLHCLRDEDGSFRNLTIRSDGAGRWWAGYGAQRKSHRAKPYRSSVDLATALMNLWADVIELERAGGSA